jgi:hypothetical protein
MARSLISAIRSSYNHSTESMKRNIRAGTLSSLLMLTSSLLLSSTSKISGEDLARKYAGVFGLAAGMYGTVSSLIKSNREDEKYFRGEGELK